MLSAAQLPPLVPITRVIGALMEDPIQIVAIIIQPAVGGGARVQLNGILVQQKGIQALVTPITILVRQLSITRHALAQAQGVLQVVVTMPLLVVIHLLLFLLILIIPTWVQSIILTATQELIIQKALLQVQTFIIHFLRLFTPSALVATTKTRIALGMSVLFWLMVQFIVGVEMM